MKRVQAAPDAHSHIFFMYQNDDERLQVLADYLKQGLANNELCIYITPEPPRKMLAKLRAIGFNAERAYRNGSLRIFEMNQTYVPQGHFVSDFMLTNINDFIQDAKNHGYNGLRTAGQMDWLAEHPEAIDETSHYEHQINELQTQHANFVGLCLYPAQTPLTQSIDNAIHAHPSYIKERTIESNRYFGHAT